MGREEREREIVGDGELEGYKEMKTEERLKGFRDELGKTQLVAKGQKER